MVKKTPVSMTADTLKSLPPEEQILIQIAEEESKASANMNEADWRARRLSRYLKALASQMEDFADDLHCKGDKVRATALKERIDDDFERVWHCLEEAATRQATLKDLRLRRSALQNDAPSGEAPQETSRSEPEPAAPEHKEG